MTCLRRYFPVKALFILCYTVIIFLRTTTQNLKGLVQYNKSQRQEFPLKCQQNVEVGCSDNSFSIDICNYDFYIKCSLYHFVGIGMFPARNAFSRSQHTEISKINVHKAPVTDSLLFKDI